MFINKMDKQEGKMRKTVEGCISFKMSDTF